MFLHHFSSSTSSPSSVMSLSSVLSLLLLSILTIGSRVYATSKYTPDWKSIDSRPLPGWYDQAKIGIFIHWGVFSVPSMGDGWFWYQWRERKNPRFVEFVERNYGPRWTYADFAPLFTAELFDPNDWAQLFAESGAKYVVLTSKHHEGFTNWPSAVSFNWNSMDVGPKRDLVGELGSAIRSLTQLKFGVYHSWYEWFNPLYLEDKKNKFATNRFVMEKSMPELVELVTKYKPEVIWSDGDWEAPPWYWNSTSFLSWLYNDSPVAQSIVVNDRWGKGTFCKHGGFWNCQDKYNPGHLMTHKWENAFTLDKTSWGFNRNATEADYLTKDELLHEVVSTVAYGGNCLINIGPTADGRILPIFRRLLLHLGNWLSINGQAIYSTSACQQHQNDTLTQNVFYTCSRTRAKLTRNAIFFDWPTDNLLALGSVPACPAEGKTPMLGIAGKAPICRRKAGRIEIDLRSVVGAVLRKRVPAPWTLKLEY